MTRRRKGWLLGALTLCLAFLPLPRLAAEEAAHFHHLGLNVTDVEAALDYYSRYFSAVRVKFRGVADALLVDRAFLIFKKVDSPPPSELKSAIWHIGWGGVDGPSEYEWRKREGVEFETPVTPLGSNHFMYAYGPSRELIEVWTGFHHNRFGHVHLFAHDVNVTTKWYVEHLGLEASRPHVPKPPPADPDQEYIPGDLSILRTLWANAVTSHGVTLNIFGKPGDPKPPWWRYDEIREFAPTRGRAVDHIAFGYRDLTPVYERFKAAGVEIVEPLAFHPELQLKSFSVLGPDRVTIEIVEARPLPEGLWDDSGEP